MATNTDTAGNVILFEPDLTLCLIGNTHKTPFLTGDQELWEYVGIDPESALAIAQGFVNHWSDVEPRDDSFERAERHRREALPRLAHALIPLPPLSSLTAEEKRPTFNLLARYNMIKADQFDVEAEYARYPFALLNELYPPDSPQPSYNEWETLLGDLFRLLYRSGHGRIHPEAVKERIPKRWILHNSPILDRLPPIDANPPSDKTTALWNKMVRWLKHHLIGKRSG
jgi:hypothetical protein